MVLHGESVWESRTSPGYLANMMAKKGCCRTARHPTGPRDKLGPVWHFVAKNSHRSLLRREAVGRFEPRAARAAARLRRCCCIASLASAWAQSHRRIATRCSGAGKWSCCSRRWWRSPALHAASATSPGPGTATTDRGSCASARSFLDQRSAAAPWSRIATLAKGGTILAQWQET
jgi:hypothetical protein